MSKKVTKKSKKVLKKKAVEQKPGRLVEIDLKLPLTDSEARQRSKLAWEKSQERDKLILERKDVANRYKARIDALTAETTTLLEESSEGLEVRSVKAREIKNHDRGMMEFWYKDELRHQRPMTLQEKQQDDLPLKESKAAPIPKASATIEEDDEDIRPRELKQGEMLTEGETPVVLNHSAASITALAKRRIAKAAAKLDPVAEAHAVDEQARREDVASVIKSETSARSKWSATDGVRD